MQGLYGNDRVDNAEHKALLNRIDINLCNQIPESMLFAHEIIDL